MHLSLRILVEALTAAGTLACLFFYALALLGIASFLRAGRKQNAQAVKTLRPFPFSSP